MRRNLVLAASFAAFVAVVLPLQTYLSNTSAYAYGLGRLVGEQVLAALLVTAFVLALLQASDRWLRGGLTPLVVALAVLLYLASGPLAFGLPEINGELPDSLDAFGRKLWDGGVWAVVLVGTFATFRWTRAWLHGIVLVVLTLGLASLFDICPDEATVSETCRGGYELAADIIDNVEYSPTRNVLLFVLDNVDAHVATDLVTADPALAAKFPGFLAYRNNIGMHDSTKLGVPGLMTGKFFEPGSGQLAKYIMSVFGPESALRAYQDRGDAIYAMFCTSSYGYTTARIDPSKRRVKAESHGPAILCRTAEVPYLTLADAVLFRTLPFAFKRQFLSTKLRQRDVIWNVDRKYDYEETVFSILARRPVSSDPQQMFLKVHTHGAHLPYLPGLADAHAATSNAVVKLSRLFDALRERGLYDRSTIVVAADHGCGQYAENREEPWKMRALLWIKPDGAQAPFAPNELPTSHARLSEVLKRAAAERLTSESLSGILRTERRLYRLRNPNDRHRVEDWIVDAAGKAVRP